MIKPNHLCAGDRVGIVAPAGPPNPRELQEGVKALQSIGLVPVIGSHVFHKKSYLAAEDWERVDDLHQMFLNPSIRAVFCARGGYGTARIAEGLDYRLIHRHPKIVWGYSDITFLLNAIMKYSELVTFHGPMIASDLNQQSNHKSTMNSFRQLFSSEPLTFITSAPPLRRGVGEGMLVGGNLTLLADSLGTPFEIDTCGKILLIEEVDEPAYRIDALFNHLQQAGKFRGLRGLILGNLNVEDEQRPMIDHFFFDFFKRYNFPVLQGFSIGHCRPNLGVPLGTIAFMDSHQNCFKTESGVL
ncbi:LD-carboxypeptidase [Halobacillus sp. BBL2006]|uniref:S66 peptidase family protein n=1 Tax=Halobacillus sp. BBL2006 TaxID=1543706 RepID=UPI0005420A77|nr:LD-carboxypeptidase [Halobacillus sp. BBL2006]KHE70975.1 peptidase S66 [Halobacillus sp. BBL2006]